MRDMALTIFTVLSQLAVGSFITLWLYNLWNKNKVSKNSGFLISLIIFFITAASLLISLFHLGHPLYAYKAILNAGESWLSREIIFFSLFVCCVAISTVIWKGDNVKNRNLIGLIGSLIGIIAIFSQSMIYIVPAVPAWNSIFTLVFFYMTAALLGPLLVGTILVAKKELTINFSKLSLSLIIIAIITIAVYVSTLFSGLDEAMLTANQLFVSGLFWTRVILLIVPLVILGITFKKQQLNVSMYGAVFMLIIASELIGRTLYYTTAVHL